MTHTAISVSDLIKDYGDIRAVDGIAFDVAEGEIFAMTLVGAGAIRRTFR